MRRPDHETKAFVLGSRWPALVLLLVVACTINPATGQRQLALLSEAQEIQIGRETHPEVLATYGAYDDPDLQRYVEEIGAKMAAISERPQLDWTFTVLDDPVINAMALPGGYVYVNRGILAYFNSEAEMASVLGHEIGHVTARHSVEQISRAQLAQIGIGVAAVASEDFRRYAGLAGVGVQLLFLKFGRDDERQSDHLGLRYMVRAGYDPREMPGVFAMLGRAHGSEGMRAMPQWLATHPDPGNRVADLSARIQALPPGERQGVVNRDGYLQRLEGLVFDEDPRQGYSIGRTYYHPELAFRVDFPDQWRIINQRQAAGALSPNEDAAVVLTLSDEASPRAAYSAFFDQQGIRSGSDLGRSVYSFSVVDSSSGNRTAEGMVSFFEHRGRVYQLMGYTDPGGWNANARAMEQSITSFAALTDRRYLDVAPKTIDLVELPQAMTLSEFAQRYPSTIELGELAIVNGVETQTRLEAGTLVKRVVGGELPAG
jgi:predicted Zn-dependent protease